MDYSHHIINDRVQLTVIDIKQFSDSEKQLLDSHLVTICEGESDSTVATVKRHIVTLFSRKTESWKMGAIAEFFIHLYIRIIGFKQECLFFNLEENSIKKGFDGLYSQGETAWLMESKAGSVSSTGISHAAKVKEAANDLKNKVAGHGERSTNNPWRNAYSHANQLSVNTALPLRRWIKGLADEFTNGVFHTIDEFNTMPCGTIFLGGVWSEQDHEGIKATITQIADQLGGQRVHAICVTHESIDFFIHYISTEENDEQTQ